MAVSAVGVFAAYLNAVAEPTSTYVVATNDIVLGQRLTAADLTTVALDLPTAQQQVSYSDLDLLVGATALGPLDAGQLITPSDVARPDGGDDRAQISISVPPGSALNGSPTFLAPGELVDVVATSSESGPAETRTVSRSAVVVSVFAGGDVLGSSGAVTLVLAVPSAELEPIAHAAAVAKLSIVRTTGLDREASMPAVAEVPPDPGPEGQLPAMPVPDPAPAASGDG